MADVSLQGGHGAGDEGRAEPEVMDVAPAESQAARAESGDTAADASDVAASAAGGVAPVSGVVASASGEGAAGVPTGEDAAAQPGVPADAAAVATQAAAGDATSGVAAVAASAPDKSGAAHLTTGESVPAIAMASGPAASSAAASGAATSGAVASASGRATGGAAAGGVLTSASGGAVSDGGVIGAGASGAVLSGAGAAGPGVRGTGMAGPGVSGAGAGPGGPGVGMYGPPPPPSPGGNLARMLGGGVIGLLVGFLVGMFAAVLVSVTVGDGMALLTLVGCTAVLGAVGAAMGAGSGRRAAAAAYQATVPYRSQSGPVPPYVPPPLFPRPELPDPPRWLLPAAAGAGVFAAVALPEAQVGLGIVLVAMVLGAAALPAVLRRMTPWTVAFGATAYWLISMAAVRDADWLVGILLVAGAGLGALAVSGAGAGWLGVIRGGISVLLALGPVPWFLAKPLKRLTARRRVLPMVVALGITTVLLLVFGLLFASADAVFASYVERLTATPDWAESAPLRIFLFALFAVLLAAVVLVALRPVVDPVGPDTRFRVSRSIWALPLSAVNLLFAAFVAVQITALFGGNTLVLRTAGLTYAEYARQGFFQLVVVSVFVLAIVAVAAGLLKVERRERWLLAVLLGVLCGLTMVVLASALHRMNLYTDAYGLSRLRLSVQATVWWLGALFALVLLAGAARLMGRGSGWLPRTIVLVTGLSLGAFALVNPDLRVAQTQVEVRGPAKLDSDYLGDLGAEAVPALDRLPEPQRSCVLSDVVKANGLDRPDPWNGWNLARSLARDVLAERPVREGSSAVPERSSPSLIKSKGDLRHSDQRWAGARRHGRPAVPGGPGHLGRPGGGRRQARRRDGGHGDRRGGPVRRAGLRGLPRAR
ncbi:DUF4153 domain-containing protein [Nonomuraea rubra]|uniref:DUF4153 domain-containing protein n=1 Tax=Nonomuraea rubra TaxID=46180 RepID=UPI003622C7A1